MSEALRLARGEPGLAYEALPGTVGQQGELADALVLLEVGENLLGDLELLLEGNAPGEQRSVAERAFLRVCRLLDQLIEHLHQLVPLDASGRSFDAGGHGADLPTPFPIEHFDRLHRLRQELV